MTWAAAALISTALFAIVTILDKRLVAHLFPGVASFNVAFGLLQIPIAIVFFAVVIPTTGFDGGSGIPWAIATGLLWAVGLFLFFHGLRLEEVSRATPMQMLAPVWASAIAVTFLGEELSWVQWAAILVVVAGGIAVNIRPEIGWFRIARGRAFLILLAASVVLAVAFVLSKEATERMNVWAIQGFRAVFMGAGIVALSWRPSLNVELRMVARDAKAMAVLFIAEGIAAPIAALMFVIAVSLGPISLVSTTTAARPLFVLALSALLSTPAWNLLNEPLDRRTLGLKLVSTVMIVGGVAVLSLG